MRYPRAEETLEAVTPVRTVCRITKEIYGYAVPVIDVDASVTRFCKAYEAWYKNFPSTNEVEYAKTYFQGIEA